MERSSLTSCLTGSADLLKMFLLIKDLKNAMARHRCRAEALQCLTCP